MARLAMVVLAGSVAVSSCASERPIVDQVQTNIVSKSVFEGEWYYQRTIVDTTEAAGLITFIGDMSFDYAYYNEEYPELPPVARIKWVITEDTLFAFRAQEVIAGGNSDAHDPTFLGEPLGAFGIVKHLDLQRKYNSSTGEYTNVENEDTSSRRWYEREYIRVDWAAADLTSYYTDAMDLYGMEPGGFHREITQYYDENALVPGYRPVHRAMSCGPDDDVERCDAEDVKFHGEFDKGEVYFLSFVSEELWSPSTWCLVYYGIDCTSSKVVVRTSFRKSSPRHEYEPLYYPNSRWENFGMFRVPQKTYGRGGVDDPTEGYSPSYGETDYLNLWGMRHNIWRQHFEHDGAGMVVRNENGQPEPLAHADKWAWENVRPIDYYLVKGTPTYLIRPAMEVLRQWNMAFVRMWRIEQGEDPLTLSRDADDYACEVIGPDAPADGGSFDAWNDDVHLEMQGAECLLRLHVNPCDADENAACIELGDLRYHFFNVIRTVNVGFSGVSLPIADPDTGELISANINYALDTNERLFTRAMDQIRAMEGVNEDLGIISGDDVRQYLANSRGRVIQPVASAPSGAYTRYGGGAGDPGIGDGGGSGAAGNDWSGAGIGAPATGSTTPGQAGSLTARILDYVERLRPTIERLKGVEGEAALLTGRWRQIGEEDPALEKQLMAGLLGGWANQPLMNSELMGMAGIIEPRDGLDTIQTGTEEEILDLISPFRNDLRSLFRPPALRHREARMALGFEFFQDLEFSDNSIEAVRAKYGECPGWEWGSDCVNEWAMKFQQDTFHFIMLHELGHSLGMRHNFGGTADFVNYPDEWYQIDARYPLPELDPINRCDTNCVDCDGDGEFDSRDFDCNNDSVVDAAEMELWRNTFRRNRELRKQDGIDLEQLSTVMEYPGQWYQWQGGLGYYDFATIGHAYANQVEAFVGDPRIERSEWEIRPIQYRDGADEDPVVFPRTVWHFYLGGERCETNLDCPAAGFDQPVRQVCTPNPRYRHMNEARRVCDPSQDLDCICSNFEEDFRDAVFYGVDCEGDGRIDGNNDRRFDCDGDEETDFVPNPYVFCSDDRLNDISWCNTYDTGSSFRDVIFNAIDDYERNYVWGNFRRYRSGFRGNMLGWYRIFPMFAKIYQHFLYRLYYEQGYQGREGGFGFDDQFIASFDTLNFFASVIARPDIGSYELDVSRSTPDRSVLRQVSDEPDGTGDVDVELGMGKWLWSTYQDHQNGYFMMERHGTHLDKFYAILSLVLRDWGLSYTYDERFFINYHTLFPSEMLQLFGGLYAGDPDRYGARLTTNEEGEPAIAFMDYSRGSGPLFGRFEDCLTPAHEAYDHMENGAPSEDGEVAPTFDDAISLSVRNYAMIAAMTNFAVYFDPTPAEQLRVCVEGTGQCVRVPETDPGDGRALVEGIDYIRYRSDRFHKTYVAYQTDGTPQYECDQSSLSFEFLRQMNADQDLLAAMREDPEADEADVRRLEQRVQGNESFLEAVVYVQRLAGIAWY